MKFRSNLSHDGIALLESLLNAFSYAAAFSVAAAMGEQ